MGAVPRRRPKEMETGMPGGRTRKRALQKRYLCRYVCNESQDGPDRREARAYRCERSEEANHSFGRHASADAIGDWQCVVRIDGLGPHPIFEFGGGVDSLQALLVGIGVLRNALKQAPCCLAWRGDSVLHLAGGIPRQTPSEFGEEFERRLEQFVLREQRRTRKFRVKIIRAQMAAEAAEKAASCLRTSSKRRQRRSD